MLKTIKETLQITLDELVNQAPDCFSGFGCIIYNGNFLVKTKFLSLRPDTSPPNNLRLGNDRLIKYLLQITKSDHKLHDGYVFFDRNGKLTHVSQFIEIQLNKDMKPHPDHGTRYLSSQAASNLTGVEYAGMIGTNKKSYIFRKGSVLDLDSPKS